MIEAFGNIKPVADQDTSPFEVLEHFGLLGGMLKATVANLGDEPTTESAPEHSSDVGIPEQRSESDLS